MARRSTAPELEMQPLTRGNWNDLVELFARPGASIAPGLLSACAIARSGKHESSRGPHLFRRVKQARAEGAGRPRRRAGPHRLREGQRDRMGLARPARGVREARALAGDEAGRREAAWWSIVCFFVDAQARHRGVAEALLQGRDRVGARAAARRCSKPIPATSRNGAVDDFMWFGAKTDVSIVPASPKWRAASRRGR